MLRSITCLSAVAAIATTAMAWPAATARSTMTMTAKQAALLVLPEGARPAREQMVSQIVVKMRAPSDMAQSMASTQMRSLSAKAGVGFKAVRPMGGDATVVALDAPMPLSQAQQVAERLARDPAVEYAEPNVRMRPMAVPTDPQFATRQWNLLAPTTEYTGSITVPMGDPPMTRKAVAAGSSNLPTAWDVTTGAASVVVAVVDTGIVNHPDLNNQGVMPFLNEYVRSPQGRFLPGYDLISEDALGQGINVENDGDVGRDNDPTDTGDAVGNNECGQDEPGQGNSWHGTHSAGIIAATANNTPTAAGIAGIGWLVRVLPVRAMGKCGGASSDIADAIRWAAGINIGGSIPMNTTPARVISVGAGTPAGTACSPMLQSAVDAAIAAGSVIVAPTGNDAEFQLSSPANCNGVISVTSHAINGENSSTANIGPAGGTGAQLPTISAPGGGSPASLGSDPSGQGAGIDNDAWDGYYVWSAVLPGQGAAGSPDYDGRIGTSAAAAQVAGVAALIKTKTPAATPAQISGALVTSVRPFPELSSCAAGRIWAGRCGAGMLDAKRALDSAGPPAIVTAPAAVTVAAGATASFSVEAVGVASYQWTRAGANIAGATAASYTTPALAASDNNVAYAVVMTNSFGTTTSPPATLTVTSAAANPPTGGGGNSSGGGGALPLAQLLLLGALLLAGRKRIGHREH